MEGAHRQLVLLTNPLHGLQMIFCWQIYDRAVFVIKGPVLIRAIAIAARQILV
jgi:hypothetical protein